MSSDPDLPLVASNESPMQETLVLQRYLLTVRYDGAFFRGSQIQNTTSSSNSNRPNAEEVDTVQGWVEDAVQSLFKNLQSKKAKGAESSNNQVQSHRPPERQQPKKEGQEEKGRGTKDSWTINTIFAGRTDAGVSATGMTAHIDLPPLPNVKTLLEGTMTEEHDDNDERCVASSSSSLSSLDPVKVVKALNASLEWTFRRRYPTLYANRCGSGGSSRDIGIHLPVSVVNCRRVVPSCHARISANLRTYRYTVRIVNHARREDAFSSIWDISRIVDQQQGDEETASSPCAPSGREPLDLHPFIGTLQDALALMEGGHDFRYLCGENNQKKQKKSKKNNSASESREKDGDGDEDFFRRTVTRCCIEKVSVAHSTPLMMKGREQGATTVAAVVDTIDLNLRIEGHSFLFQQVRRMIGAAVGVALGKVPDSILFPTATIQQGEEVDNGDSEQRKRSLLEQWIAPALPLVLSEVHYPAAAMEEELASGTVFNPW